MAIVVDLIILGIILLSAYLGYRKGLIGVAFKIISFLIAIVITLLLYKPVANLVIEHTNWDDQLEQFIIEKFANTNTSENGSIQKEDTNMPDVIVGYINSMIKDTVDNSKEAIINTISHGLTINSIQLVVMLLLFVVTRLLLIFAKAILELISKIPIIKQCNEVGGILYGILRGILVIYLILGIISLLVPFIANTVVVNIINQSFIGKVFYNNNLILMLFF